MFLPSLPFPKTKGKTEEMDPKKLKKFEKEEKDFRKKFKVCFLYVFYLLISLFNCQNHICRNISKCDYTVY